MIIQTCDQTQKEFLNKYYPIGRTNQMLRAITSFFQNPGELFHETWERLRDLLRKRPHHAVPKWQLVQYFKDNLFEPHCQMVDVSCDGTFITKNENEAWEFFDTLSDNSIHHASVVRSDNSTSNIIQKKNGVYESGHSVDIHSKVDLLTQKLDHFFP